SVPRVPITPTRGTLTSSKFGKLLASLEGQAQFVVQPCDGLAHAIERSVNLPQPALGSAGENVDVGASAVVETETGVLCERYIHAMGAFGTEPGQIDTLVLGCTHYIFVAHELRALVGHKVQLIETGEPVARQTRRLLEAAGLLQERAASRIAGDDGGADANAAPSATPEIRLLTTGPVAMLQAAAQRWLGLPGGCCASVSVP
ncbi:MAG: hypothetical protein EOO29_43000, partial [Comamonadaceae bacterium]